MKQDTYIYIYTKTKKIKSKNNKNILHQVKYRVTNNKMGKLTAKAEKERIRKEVEHYSQLN
jgi:hypothetical protein